MSDASTTWARVWPHLRALLIAVHVFAVSAMAFPAPGGGMKRSAWADPTVQGEFEAWTARFNAMGIDVTEPELEDFLWEFASRFMAVRGKVLAPFRLYYDHFGTYQTWRMFVAPHRYPATLSIDVDRGAGFEPLYVERSREYDWHAYQFDHDRMRSAVFRYSWSAYKREYRAMCTWIAEQVHAEMPDAQRVRVQYYKYRTRTPEQVRAGVPIDGKYQQTTIIELGDP